MNVAPQPEVAEAGPEVFMKESNAIDAAVCAALVKVVVDSQMCGITGFGNCQIMVP